MRTLLVYPRFFAFSSPPLGLAYIASSMRKEGLDVHLLDCTFGKTVDDIFKTVRDYRPGIVAFSMMTRNLIKFRKIVKGIREIDKKIKIVAGGPHPSVMPMETMKDYDVDIVIIGEGERTMTELVKALRSGRKLSSVNGIAYRRGKKVIRTKPNRPIENLDEIPFPARDLLPMRKYIQCSIGRSSWTVPRPSTTIMNSRGCPYQCTFCAAHLIHGRKVRMRSPKNVVDEMEMLIREYGLKGIWFNDDSFTLNRKWVMEILDEIEKRKIKAGWGCNTRVNLVDHELLKRMRDCGCRFISFGVESGVQDILDKCIKKGIRLNDARRAFRLASRVGIVTQATFMVGIPGETLSDMEKSLEFAKEIEPDSIQVSITTPLPKTELVDIIKKFGTMDITDWEKIDYMWNGVIRTKDFTPEQVRSVQKRFLMKFYFRKKYFLNQIRRIRSFQDLITRIRGFYQLVGGHISPLSFFRKEVT